MLDRSTMAATSGPPAAATDVIAAMRELSSRELAPLVRQIDADGLYPEAVMRGFGRAGAYAQHLPDLSPKLDLGAAIEAMATAGEHCLSTSFCIWCQDALAWYIFASANDGLKKTLGRRVADGDALGGTALSNPMKTFFGIETIRLKGKRVEGGYVVRGALPFVSNLGDDHYFGATARAASASKRPFRITLSCPDARWRRNRRLRVRSRQDQGRAPPPEALIP